MEEYKTITSISISPSVKKEAFRLANYHGFSSVSNLVETLLIEWIKEKNPEFRKVGESKEETQ